MSTMTQTTPRGCLGWLVPGKPKPIVWYIGVSKSKVLAVSKTQVLVWKR